MRMASEDRRRQLPWVIPGLTVILTAAIIFAHHPGPLQLKRQKQQLSLHSVHYSVQYMP